MNAHSPTATDTLRQAAAQYEGNLVFATSFGAEDQVLTHMISHLGLNIPLATLDTGRLFPETYELWARTEEIYGIRIIPYFPAAEEVESMILDKGVNLFRNSVENRHKCCNIRKLRPLERLLAGKKAWICGLRSTKSITQKDFISQKTMRRTASSKSARWPTGQKRMSGTISALTAFPTILFMMQDSPVSGAPAAQEPSRGQKTYATDDGGGKKKNTGNAAYTAGQDINNQKKNIQNEQHLQTQPA